MDGEGSELPGFGVPGVPIGPVTHAQAVAWGELDALGHVNHTVFLRWMENARMAWFGHVGIAAWMHASEGRLGPILARIGCEYRAPVGYPDRVLTTVECVALGRSSLTLRSRIGSVGKQMVVAEGEVVVVLVDYAGGGKAVAVPEAIRAAIRAIDHAVLQERGA